MRTDSGKSVLSKVSQRIYADTFYEVSPEDSDIWLDVLMLADVYDPNLASILQYLRNTGTKLERDDKFGYRLVPYVGKEGWESLAQYKQEVEYLKPYRTQLVMILKKLGGKL